jgi:predicted metal-dependent phosphoesterase TrpH
MKFADLHVHTFYSDSTFSPEEVVTCAAEKGLSGIAICDHDSVDGIDLCRETGDRMGVEIIPGIELTIEKADAEIHLLGYFMDYKAGWFVKKLKEIQEARVERIHKMVEKLNAEGINVRAEDVFALSGKGSVGRLHLAQAMLKTGKVATFKEVFDKYIGFRKPCYVTNVRFTPKEAIETLLKIGGVPVLAHPDVTGADEYIPELMECGLRGIEVYHTDHRPGVIKHYEALARETGLLMTGGSDCHGLGKGRVLLGGIRVPYTMVEALREESGRIKAKYG